jgi:hypothetical protein
MQKTQHMLYPTLEQGDDDNDDHDSILQHHEHGHKSSKRSSNQSQQTRSASVLPAALRANFEFLEQQSPSKRQRCSGCKALATETAALVSQEVQRMQDSIAELENLLAVQEEEEQQQQQAVGAAAEVRNDNVVLPALPAAVVVYDNPNHRSQVDADADNQSCSNDDEVPCTAYE